MGWLLELGSGGERSLIPWLTGTALIHCMLAWRHRGTLKKAALSLAIAALVTIGTLAVPLSRFVVGRTVLVGEEFFDNVLIATGVPLLGATALAPLLNWGASPSKGQRLVFAMASIAGGLAVSIALALGVRQPTCPIVAFFSVVAAASLAGVLILDGLRESPQKRWLETFGAPQMTPNHEIAIRAKGLSEVLGGRTVISHIDLDVAEGRRIALLGDNGTGKTTLLRCLAFSLRPTGGGASGRSRGPPDGPCPEPQDGTPLAR